MIFSNATVLLSVPCMIELPLHNSLSWTHVFGEDDAVELARVSCQHHCSRIDEVVAQFVDKLRVLIADGLCDHLAPESR